MNIFLSGARGFLGRALTLALRRKGHAIAAFGPIAGATPQLAVKSSG
jgi:nucleoside-diphosphate-sugar epimerase